MIWALWYTDSYSGLNVGTLSVKDSGRYKLQDGKSLMTLTTFVSESAVDENGATCFDYVGNALPIVGGRLTGIFNGTMYLAVNN